MDLKEMLALLRNQNVEVSLHLCHWNNTATKVTTVSPSIGSRLSNQIGKIVLNNVDQMSSMEQVEYNIIGGLDETVEVAKRKEYRNNIDLVIRSFSVPTQHFRFSPDNFDFFVYDIIYRDEHNEIKHIYAFKRTKKLSYLRKGFVGHVQSGTFSEFTDKDLIATDGTLDLIISEDAVYIFQHISFERMFHLKNGFIEGAEQVLKSKELENTIDNFALLKQAALDNANYVKRLAKLADGGDVALFTRDLNATEEVVKEFQLDIDVDVERGKIIYENEGQVGNFVKLMQDAYYKTLLGHRKGIDERNNIQQ